MSGSNAIWITPRQKRTALRILSRDILTLRNESRHYVGNTKAAIDRELADLLAFKKAIAGVLACQKEDRQ